MVPVVIVRGDPLLALTVVLNISSFLGAGKRRRDLQGAEALDVEDLEGADQPEGQVCDPSHYQSSYLPELVAHVCW